MKILKHVKDMTLETGRFEEAGKVAGFVPTMGALHNGHVSLIQRSVFENDITIASIFVNPNQFNNPDDLKNYPRNLENDIRILENSYCDILFIPDVKEIYPEPDTRIFDFGTLDKVMEGLCRPGHFNGVAQVVSRLFDIVKPCKAYFGEKDFQQFIIIKKMVEDLHYNIKLLACPIIREPDGLAMSSRNMLLSPHHRTAAPLIARTLTEAVSLPGKGKTVNEVTEWVISRINSEPALDVEYFQLVNEEGLHKASHWGESGGIIGCIAVHAGNVRLIDNIRFNF